MDQQTINYYLMKGDFAKLTKFLNDGVDVNLMSVLHRTDILVESMVKNKFFVFERALKASFDLNMNDFLYLHHAARTKQMDFVELLVGEYVRINKDINEIESNGNNLLHTSVLDKNINYKMISYFMGLNIGWDWKNNVGQTPLHFLLRNVTYLEDFLLKYFLENKELFNIKDNIGICGKDIVESYSYDEHWMEFENNKILKKGILNGK